MIFEENFQMLIELLRRLNMNFESSIDLVNEYKLILLNRMD